MTSLITDQGEVWRRVRYCARFLDRTVPFWWKEPIVLVVLLRDPSDVVTRCWQQLIRQRIGK